MPINENSKLKIINYDLFIIGETMCELNRLFINGKTLIALVEDSLIFVQKKDCLIWIVIFWQTEYMNDCLHCSFCNMYCRYGVTCYCACCTVRHKEQSRKNRIYKKF